MGFSFILQNVGLLWLGGSHRSVPDFIHSQDVLVTIAGVPITNGDVLAIAVTTPLVIVLVNFIARSRIGKAMRATAQDPEAARLMGINVDTTRPALVGQRRERVGPAPLPVSLAAGGAGPGPRPVSLAGGQRERVAPGQCHCPFRWQASRCGW